MPPCITLSIIRQGSRVKWRNPGKGVAPSLHLGVVAIEKGTFGSPSTMVANFTYKCKQVYSPPRIYRDYFEKPCSKGFYLTPFQRFIHLHICIHIYIYIYIYIYIKEKQKKNSSKVYTYTQTRTATLSHKYTEYILVKR